MPRSCYQILLTRMKQRVQLPGAIKRYQLIATTDVPPADEYLRDCGAATRATRGLLTSRRPVRRVDLADRHAFAPEQRERPGTERTPGLGIDFDVGHSELLGRYS